MTNRGMHWTSQRANAPKRIAAVAWQAFGYSNPALAAELTALAHGALPESAPTASPLQPAAAQPRERAFAKARFRWGGWVNDEGGEGIIITATGSYTVRAGSPSARRIQRLLTAEHS